MPLLSVFMPSYNHGKFIASAIESILNQTVSDFELIIIDDGSKDNSKEIIESYRKKDNRIKAIYHERNLGIARTVNEGIVKAKGKFWAIIASDDIWAKDKVKKQIEVLGKNENLVVWTEGQLIDAEGNTTGRLWTDAIRSKCKRSGDIFQELFKWNVVFPSSIIVKRQNIEGLRYDEAFKYWNDVQFVVALARKYEYFFIPESLTMYRRHGGNVTILEREAIYKEGIGVRKYFLQKYGKELKRKTKSKMFWDMGIRYCFFGQKGKGINCIFRAIKLHPFVPLKNARNLYTAFIRRDMWIDF